MRKSTIPAPAFALPSSIPDFILFLIRFLFSFLNNGLTPGA